MITSHAQISPPSLVCTKFSQTSGTFVLFSRGHSFHLCFGNLFTIKFAIFIFKARLGGEICLTDVIVHKGYCWHQLPKIIFRPTFKVARSDFWVMMLFNFERLEHHHNQPNRKSNATGVQMKVSNEIHFTKVWCSVMTSYPILRETE